jgi:outer membrane immunogenic protein
VRFDGVWSFRAFGAKGEIEMRKLFLWADVALIAALISGQALAADIKPSPQPVYTKAPQVAAPVYAPWTRFYFGGHIGYGLNLDDTTVTPNTTFGAFSADLGAAQRGPLFGGQIGADFQPTGSDLVVGWRVLGSLANLRAGGQIAAGGTALSVDNATNYLGNADLRIGYAGFGNGVLFYLDGGLGFVGAKPNFAIFNSAFTTTLQQGASDTSVGWNVGGGIETQVTKWASAFAEFDYYDVGTKSLTLQLGPTTLMTSNAPYKIATVMFGLNFHPW